MPNCATCGARPAADGSRHCWEPHCPCWVLVCDGCERRRPLPDSPLCGPCTRALARDPARPRVPPRAPPEPGRTRQATKKGAGHVERKWNRWRARVWVAGRPVWLPGYYATPALAAAALRAYRAAPGGRDQRRAA